MRKVRLLFLFIALGLCKLLGAQRQLMENIHASLDREVEETSGLALDRKGRLITINDGGAGAILYFLDSLSGKVVHRQSLTHAVNVDWEELAMDEKGNLFVGDFGNNLNMRRDLCIYKVQASNLGAKTAEVEKINIRYAEQKAFPPRDLKRWHFDMEAMLAHNDSLYLFSKNRSKPFNGYTYIYRLPAKAGDYVLERFDSLFLGDSWNQEFWVTAADYDRARKRVGLLSYHRLFLIENWSGGKFSNKPLHSYRTPNLRQREAVLFDRNTIWVSEEGDFRYRTHLLKFVLEADTLVVLNPVFEDELRLKGFVGDSCYLAFELFNQLGMRIKSGMDKKAVHGRFMQRYDFANVPPGKYVLHLMCGEEKRAFRIEKPRKTKGTDGQKP